MIDEKGEAFDLATYLAPVARRKWLITVFCMSAVMSSLAITYVLSEKYRASLTVLYQPREDVMFQSKAREALGFPLPLVPLETIANTLEDIVTGDAVLEETVRRLRLDVKPKKAPFTGLAAMIGDARDWFKETRQNAWQILKYGRILAKDSFRATVETLRANLSLKRVNKAYTFRLEVLNEDPKRAASIVEMVGALLADAVARDKSHAEHENRIDLEARRKQASAEVVDLRAQLKSLKANTGISSLDEELSLRLKTINAFEEELSRDRVLLRSLEERRTTLERQLAAQKPTQQYDLTMAENPVFGQLRMEKAQLEIDRAGLLEKFTPLHKDVKAVDSKLAETNARLGKEEREILHSESTRSNDLHEKVESDLLGVRADTEAARAKESSLQETLTTETAFIRTLVKDQPAIDEAIFRLTAAESSFKLINEAYEEARLAESKTVSEILIPNPPTIPFEPVRPIKILHVGVTFILAFALAIAFAFFGHFFDSTIYDTLDAERALGHPVLAAIPPTDGLRWSES